MFAGDGNGPVRMLIDPTGGRNFPAAGAQPTGATYAVTLTPVTTSPGQSGVIATYAGDPAAGPQAVNNNPYEFTFTIPADIQCTGTFGADWINVCTVQISSSSAWYSGFSFSTSPKQGGGTASAGPSTPIGQCRTYSSLFTPSRPPRRTDVFVAFCLPTDYPLITENASRTILNACRHIPDNISPKTGVSTRMIWIPDGLTQEVMDASVRAEFDQNIGNRNVFAINTDDHTESFAVETPCTKSYLYFLCAQAFQPCNPTNTAPATFPANIPCGPTCKEFTCWCQLNPKHANLYVCGSYDANSGRDSSGICPILTDSNPAKLRGFGPRNATCVPTSPYGADGECIDLALCAAPHAASYQPVIILVAALATAIAVFFQ